MFSARQGGGSSGTGLWMWLQQHFLVHWHGSMHAALRVPAAAAPDAARGGASGRRTRWGEQVRHAVVQVQAGGVIEAAAGGEHLRQV